MSVLACEKKLLPVTWISFYHLEVPYIPRHRLSQGPLKVRKLSLRTPSWSWACWGPHIQFSLNLMFCVFVCAHTCGCQRTTLGVMPQGATHLVILTVLNSPNKLDWLTGKSQGSPVSSSPGLELRVHTTTSGTFIWAQGIKPRSLYLQSNALLTEPSLQPHGYVTDPYSLFVCFYLYLFRWQDAPPKYVLIKVFWKTDFIFPFTYCGSNYIHAQVLNKVNLDIWTLKRPASCSWKPVTFKGTKRCCRVKGPETRIL